LDNKQLLSAKDPTFSLSFRFPIFFQILFCSFKNLKDK